MTSMMPLLGVALPAFAVGAVAGGAFYASLWWNTRLFLAGGPPARAFAVQLLRLGLLGGVLALVATQGAAALLAAALGVLVARTVTLRRVRGRP